MKKAYKLLLTLFGLVLIVGLTACGNNEEPPVETAPPIIGEETPPVDLEGVDIADLLAEFGLPAPRFTPDSNTPSWQTDQDMVEITWYVNFGWWAPSTLGDDFVTQVAYEDLGVIINFISGSDDNLRAMLATGDLPDIVTVWEGMDITRQAYEWAFPLNVLSQIYDPYFMANVVPPMVANWHTLPDGHFYGMPNDAWYVEAIEAGIAWPNAGFMVRQDIFEAIGSPDMTTPEGFLQALRDARDYMPTADHGVPLIGIGGEAIDIISGGLGSFGGSLQDSLAIPFVDAAGNWYDRDANPEYLEWLLVLRQALEEGLMSSDQFSDDDAFVQERLSLGTYFAYISSNVFGVGAALMNNDARGTNQTYIPVSGPRNSNGDRHTFPAGGLNGWTQTFVTRGTVDPQTAMQVVTYFASDHGNLLFAFGVEGETFEWVDGLAVMNEDVAPVYGEYGLGRYWMLRNLAFTNRIGNRPNIALQEILAYSQQFNQARLEMQNIDPTDGGQLQRNIGYMNNARALAVVAVIQSSSDAEGTAIWQEFLDSREDFQLSQIVEFRNASIAANRARLN